MSSWKSRAEARLGALKRFWRCEALCLYDIVGVLMGLRDVGLPEPG